MQKERYVTPSQLLPFFRDILVQEIVSNVLSFRRTTLSGGKKHNMGIQLVLHFPVLFKDSLKHFFASVNSCKKKKKRLKSTSQCGNSQPPFYYFNLNKNCPKFLQIDLGRKIFLF